MSTFVINHYFDINSKQLSVEITGDLVYAEDIVIYLAKQFRINPIARHLFGLYHQNNKIWLSSNQLVADWNESKTFDFRLRFRPKSIDSLKFNLGPTHDYNAFHYYFNQIRNDFICGKFENQSDGKIFGLAVTDMVRQHLKTKTSSADKIIEDFSVFLPQNSRKPKLFVRDKIRVAFYKALNSSQQQNDPIVYVEHEFIQLFITSLCPNYGIETYDVMFDNRFSSIRHHLVAVRVQYQHFPDCDQKSGIIFQYINVSKNEWTKLCSINDIGFISLDSKTKTVEISRTNGVPFSLMFKHDLDMKSFVSLLDGYYRLSVKWSFNICKDISSPSLAKLRKHKTHGPIDYKFALKLLKEKANDMTGAYIIRESISKYEEYKLDVFIRNDLFETFKLKLINTQIFVESLNKYFDSVSDLIKKFSFIYCDETPITLTHCITPSEHDVPSNLLLCRLESNQSPIQSEADRIGPPVIPTDLLKMSTTTLTNNSRYGVRLANLQNKQLIVKELKSPELTQEFLKTVSEWTHLRNDSIVVCRGITLYSPLSILLEYLPIGALDTFLMTNKTSLKKIELIESVSHLSRALWYLFENNVVHGHIRCHNLLVCEYTSTCFRVKLSDPISDNDINMEGVWLPPEYLNLTESNYSLKRLTHSVDVWAFGTTVWQIFSYGLVPNSEDMLIQPKDCPNEIWTLINECWTTDWETRKQPHSIYRDVNQIFYEIYNSERNDYYSTPVFEDQKPNKVFLKNWRHKFNSFSGSTFSLSSGSVVSNQSLSTYLADSIRGNQTTIDSDIFDRRLSSSDQNGFDGGNNQTNEPWIIEPQQLKLGKVIGTGCYGEVLKATLTHCAGLKEEVVAVKRIKTVPSESHLKDMKREIEIMKKLSHKNIVEIKGFVEDLSDCQTMLVMEFVELGSLVSYLRQNRSNKSNIPLVKFANDINLGMEYLESKSIVHRDLAARNILVGSATHVKISDFGLAQFLDPNKQYYTMKTNRELPLRWYAIESLKFLKFSHKSDIWSFGVVLWEMYSFGEYPDFAERIDDSELLQTLEANIRLPLPEGCPQEVYQIMRSCWQKDSHLRPTFSQLKESLKEMPQ